MPLVRKNDDAVGVAVNEVARSHLEAAARDRHLELPPPRPRRRCRNAPGREDGEAERLDPVEVAHGAVDDETRDAALQREPRHLVAPERVPEIASAADNEDRAGGARSAASLTERNSPGGVRTVNAGPASRVPRQTGRIRASIAIGTSAASASSAVGSGSSTTAR